MKTLFKPLLVLAVTAIAFTSCMKDDSADREAAQRQQEEAIAASLASDELKIEAYLAANPSEGWQEDDTEYPLTLIGKSPKRGFWFEVLETPTEEDDEAYTYEFSGQGYKAPKVKLTYTASLLNGTEVQSEDAGDFDFATLANNTTIYNQVWFSSFFPKTIRSNGEDYPVGGLTAKGLKKGSKIRVVAPSIWAFGSNKVGDIPANSPLVYEFEVLEIE
ncbi:FKBP-type peptidyl-prolyl cis-trans isomerase [Sphingobacterium sp. FBM7-1]|uniref:FKBP-type peptidyl-prolyl cis-trans isomerase n=1 Tax=Sphingobacterium sp. FBM7-1 TaxID=2886688 RepID=UPI001D120763|nr:hypothetical protein [Sphingobacterium sp. FBM7-1]MCC2599065.1 hypothetical protein [Sphingobacterium sp. FBM7-1]